MPNVQRLREILEGFDASALMDVIILGVLLYATLRLIAGSRAMTQARGALAVILGAVILGRTFDLTAINFIVRQSFSGLIIGGAILFQPEIRRTLDRLGRTGFHALSGTARGALIDAVVLATQRMASSRTGAIIVFERGTGLQDVIETGVAVDAIVSPELLSGIFFPNSPLHDMAVVIREERVVAAGCVLPLADALASGQGHLGTRHRAAVGVTETTDACALVVSEETGDIRIAVSGRLIRVPDERRLRSTLDSLLDPARFATSPGGAQ
ncbi:MAG: diadenylate cyclase CdaA [Dehalococcoidia bacterium]